jgi:hypothetical protein
MRQTLAIFLFLAAGSAQAATVTIDFEGVVADSDSLIPVTPYTEDGYKITASDINGIFGKDWIGLNSNGSAVFGWCSNGISCESIESITLVESGGINPFDLLSLDSSNLNFEFAGSLSGIGNYDGGGSISTTLVLSTNTWNTYSFDSSWQGLSSVMIAPVTGNWDPAIDNIVVNTVPIPAAVWLFGSALAGLGWLRRRKTA